MFTGQRSPIPLCDAIALYFIPDKLTPNDEPEFLYYMSDGVYGSFACKLLDHTIPAPFVHKVCPSALAEHQQCIGVGS